jgi:hypothetical protein
MSKLLSLTLTDRFRKQTGLFIIAGYTSLIFNPSQIRANYTPQAHPQFTDLAARNLGAWFLLSGLIRLGAWWTWQDFDAGFRGWFDASAVTLLVPLWHYALERNVWDTVANKQMLLAYPIDGLGLLWMLWARKDVLSLS